MSLINEIPERGVLFVFGTPSADGRHWGRGHSMIEAEIDSHIRQSLAAMRQILGCYRRPSLLDRQLRKARKGNHVESEM
jgi:hypothetical protein